MSCLLGRYDLIESRQETVHSNAYHPHTYTSQVVLLGQNVNSYHDQSPEALAYSAALPSGGEYQVAEGFSNLYRSRGGKGVYFVDLLDQVRPPVG